MSRKEPGAQGPTGDKVPLNGNAGKPAQIELPVDQGRRSAGG